MAAAGVLLGVFIGSAVGSAEAAGLTVGQRMMVITDLPVGPTKSQQVTFLQDAARSEGVGLALVVPDRRGRADHFSTFVFNGTFARPTLWAQSTQRPASQIDDEVIAWTYAVDGAEPAVAAFLRDIRAAGYRCSTISTKPSLVLLSAVAAPGVAPVAAAVVGGVGIALLAESRRRTPRTRARLLSGWSVRRIVGREAAEISGLVAACFAPAWFLVLVVGLDATPAFQDLLLSVAAVATLALAFVVIGLHVALTVVSQSTGLRRGPASWRTAAVSAIAVLLVVSSTLSTQAILRDAHAADGLVRALAAESAQGDDVVLGVGYTDEAEELELGRIGRDAIAAGTARMAMTNFLPDALLVAGGGLPPALQRAADEQQDGTTVLIPRRLAGSAPVIEAQVRGALAESWELDDRQPPRELPVSSVIVADTSQAIRSAERWTWWLLPRGDPSDDLPIVVLHTLDDIALHRLGTATRNGEVRFRDRAALERALHTTGAIDAVTQVNRVGTTIDRQLSVVRTERVVMSVAMGIGVIGLWLAAMQLVGDHRVRTRSSVRLLAVVGRSASWLHLRFVVVGATVAAVAAALAASSTAEPAAAWNVPAACAIAALGTATLLTLGLLTSRDRRRRPR